MSNFALARNEHGVLNFFMIVSVCLHVVELVD